MMPVVWCFLSILDVYRALKAKSMTSQSFSKMKGITDLRDKVMAQPESFFINYNELEGKKFKLLERISAQQVLKIIKPK
jgi:hypothetical protein